MLNCCEIPIHIFWQAMLAVPGFSIGNLENITKLAVGWTSDLALESNGIVWAWGRNQEGQLRDGTNTDSATPVQVKFSQNDLPGTGIHN